MSQNLTECDEFALLTRPNTPRQAVKLLLKELGTEERQIRDQIWDISRDMSEMGYDGDDGEDPRKHCYDRLNKIALIVNSLGVTMPLSMDADVAYENEQSELATDRANDRKVMRAEMGWRE